MKHLGSAALILLLAGCSASKTAPPIGILPAPSQATAANSAGPYPQAYEESRAGYVPHAVDLQARPGPEYPTLKQRTARLEKFVGVSRAPLAVVGQDDSGGQAGMTILHDPSTGDGSIWVAQDAVIAPNLNIPSPSGFGNYLYAPTTKGPNGNCIETTTDYWNNAGNPNYDVQIWNFCTTGQDNYIIPIDAAFWGTYVRVYANGDGRPQYISEVYRGSSGEWHQLFYNNNTQTYDEFDCRSHFTTCAGSSDLFGQRGWSIFETHFGTGTTCPHVPTIGASGLRIRNGGTWSYVPASELIYGPPGPPSDCFNASNPPPYYSISFNINDVAWSVTDPSYSGGAGGTGGGGGVTPGTCSLDSYGYCTTLEGYSKTGTLSCFDGLHWHNYPETETWTYDIYGSGGYISTSIATETYYDDGEGGCPSTDYSWNPQEPSQQFGDPNLP